MRSLALMTLALVGFLARVGGATAAEVGQYRVADGLALYLGVIPAEIIRGQDEGMHGTGAARGKHLNHIVVAVFDATTGERITDAEVSARVAEVGLAGREKSLEKMSIAGTVSFGNYFDLRGSGPYRIEVRVRRPGAKVVSTEFRYEHYLR